jgi:hypothetical protein
VVAGRSSGVLPAGDKGYTTIYRAGVDGGKVSRFSLFVYEGALGGVFDIEDSKFRIDTSSTITAVAPPFQIGAFSVSSRAQLIRNGTDSSYPIAFTISTSVRPAEVWSLRRKWCASSSLEFP